MVCLWVIGESMLACRCFIFYSSLQLGDMLCDSCPMRAAQELEG